MNDIIFIFVYKIKFMLKVVKIDSQRGVKLKGRFNFKLAYKSINLLIYRRRKSNV